MVINVRLHISLTKIEEELLTVLAKRDQVSRERKATQLIRLALEDEEDRALSRIAEIRDVLGAKVMSHKAFWKVAKTTLRDAPRRLKP